VRNEEANHDAGHARERIAEILRSAMGGPEEEGLEDEAWRLMLHLSVDQPEALPVTQPATLPVSGRMPLLKRLLGKPNGDMGA
jgi:hypothetical protein